MAFETLVAAFDTSEHAMAAVKALEAGGFHPADISVIDSSRLTAAKGVDIAAHPPGLWQRLFGTDLHKYEATVYADTIEDGEPWYRFVCRMTRSHRPAAFSIFIVPSTCTIAR
jgi:hypothetical protein